ncbi:MAG: acyltransferase [Planctomycetaceae bacterium]|nr:acyltransferase [Planctomycetaceae bacterium]
MLRRRIAELDGLRGIAIVLVLLVHFGAVYPAHAFGERLVQSLMTVGWCGVDLFFVLSGFLITGILLDTRDDPGYFRKFFARRVLRIFPLYYAVLIGAFLIVPVWVPGVVDDGLRSAQTSLWCYLSNLNSIVSGAAPMRGTVFNFAHFWSLAIEEQFYLIWPFVVIWVKPKWLPKLCLGLILLGIPTRLAAYYWIGPFAPYYFTPCRVETLAWGALCATMIRNQPQEYWGQFARWAVAIGATGVTTLFMANGGLHFIAPAATIWSQTFFAVAFSGCVLLAYDSESTRLGSWLRWHVLQTLGKYSYGIYVMHGLLQVFLWQFVDDLVRVAPNYYVGVTCYVAACGVGCLCLARVTWEFEKMFLKLKSYFDYDAPEHATPVLAIETVSSPSGEASSIQQA